MPTSVKVFKTYDEQVDLLVSRGMDVGGRADAISHLQRVNYYRLSGYWYSFRRLNAGSREDHFFTGTSLDDVIKLYDFDARLRTTAFDALAPIELAVRAALGHALGEIDECAHLKPNLLNARASQGDTYAIWLDRYNKERGRSLEDFVTHHEITYDGKLPVWAAVEILDWGSLRYLYGFCPRRLQDEVADIFGLRAPQFESWMKALEIVRNACAHHGRLFNRNYTKTPRLPVVGRFPDLDKAGPHMNRTFGQLTLIQHMRQSQGIGRSRMLSKVLETYPNVRLVPLSHVGVPTGWKDSSLWAT